MGYDFKVGDIVTGKENNGYDITTNKSIMKIVETRADGKVVVEIIEHDRYPEEIGERYTVEPKSITLFKEQNNEIIIYQKDNKVIAEHKEKKLQAIARCHPQDEFDFMTGAKLALERLDEMLNPPLYYVRFTDMVKNYLNVDIKTGMLFVEDKRNSNYSKTKFTLEEIEEMNPNYLPFAVRVEED